MSGIFGGGDTTVTNQTVIPKFLEDALKGTITGAEDLHDAGAGFSPYPGATHVPLTGDQTSALDATRAIASGTNPLLNPALTAVGSTLKSGGITPQMQKAFDALRSIMSGGSSIGGASQYADLFGQAGAPTSSQANLSSTAAGDFLGSGNPYVNDVLKRSIADATTAANENIAVFGRGGSPYHTETLAREIGDLSSRTRMSNYENERARQMQAAGMIDNSATQRFNSLMAMIQGGSGIDAANIANQAGAAGNVLNAAGAASDRTLGYANAASGISGMRYDDAGRLYDAGKTQQSELQSELNSMIQRFQLQDMAPWNRLGMAVNTIGGTSQPFYSSQTTTPDDGSNFARLLGGVGTALSGAGAAGFFGG